MEEFKLRMYRISGSFWILGGGLGADDMTLSMNTANLTEGDDTTMNEFDEGSY